MSIHNVVFGINPVLEAIASGKSIDKIFISKNIEGATYRNILHKIHQNAIPYSNVPPIKLNKLTTKPHQGIVALLSPIPFIPLHQIIQSVYERGEIPLIILLDGVTDVGNVGAIIRTAVCVGAHALVVPTQGSASLGDATMKTSTGALAHLPICREPNLKDSIEYVHACGLQVIACHEKTEKSIYNTDFTVPTALLLGDEKDGITKQLLQLVDTEAAIPMVGPISSLNVSVAAGVILYESYRQRCTMLNKICVQ
jgi:23S rRNA (guanosine2251-2'-O)-methyltransferase